MTRETKIALLVGLVFLIVIGVLLSDHVVNATNPTPAPIAQVLDQAKDALRVPGAVNPNNAIVQPPKDVQQTGPVRVVGEASQPSGIADVKIGPAPAGSSPDASASPADRGIARVYVPPVSPGDNGHVEPLVPGNAANVVVGAPDPVPAPGVGSLGQLRAPDPVPAAVKMEEYKAVAGDTVAKMAKKFYGADTKANRDLIINANAVLKADPRKIVIGKTYSIPAKSDAASSRTMAAASTRPTTVPAAVSPAGPDRIYLVKAGDTISKIAREQLHDANGVDAIRKLNRDVLKNGDALKIGMKLHLPAAKSN